MKNRFFSALLTGTLIALAFLGMTELAVATTPSTQTSPAQAALVRAQAAASDMQQRGVGLLFLGHNDSLSQLDDAILAHSSASRYALRNYGLIVMQEGADGLYRLQSLHGVCDGQDACAEDAFMDTVMSPAQVKALTGRDPVDGPLFVVFNLHDAQAIGWSDGFEHLSEIVNFAQALGKATVKDPALHLKQADFNPES